MPRNSTTQANPRAMSNVVALRGDLRPDVVMQVELAELEQAQLAKWHAGKRAALMSERLRMRIQEGASVEIGTFYFDESMEQAAKRSDAA